MVYIVSDTNENKRQDFLDIQCDYILNSDYSKKNPGSFRVKQGNTESTLPYSISYINLYFCTSNQRKSWRVIVFIQTIFLEGYSKNNLDFDGLK